MTLRGPGPAALVAVLVAACGSSGASPTPRPSASAAPTTTASSSAAPTPVGTADACAVAAQPAPPPSIAADFATALAFAPDGRLFYAERAGTVRVWQGGASHVFATVPTVTTEAGGGYSERGLLGLAVSPSFTADHLVFAFYSDADRAHQHVIRWRDCAGQAQDARVIITLPSGADCCHKGGRIRFGGDGKLYVTLGEEHTASAAQNTADVRGKLLRYNPDGSVPGDNPFGPGNPVWAYGLRNPFGLGVAADGTIAVSANGPSGDAGSPSTGYDIVIAAVRRGAGYTWPVCYGYGHPIAASACPAGQLGPDWSSESRTVVPTGLAYIDAQGPPAYAGHLVLCTFNSGMLVLSPGAPHWSAVAGSSACRLDVVEGPDHAVYVSDTSHIARLTS